MVLIYEMFEAMFPNLNKKVISLYLNVLLRSKKTGLLSPEISGVSLSIKGDEVVAVTLPNWNPNLEVD